MLPYQTPLRECENPSRKENPDVKSKASKATCRGVEEADSRAHRLREAEIESDKRLQTWARAPSTGESSCDAKTRNPAQERGRFGFNPIIPKLVRLTFQQLQPALKHHCHLSGAHEPAPAAITAEHPLSVLLGRLAEPDIVNRLGSNVSKRGKARIPTKMCIHTRVDE